MRNDIWKCVGAAVVLAGLTLGLTSGSQTKAALPLPRIGRDGQHDFDFNFGTWVTDIKYLHQLANGQTEWDELNGAVTDRKVWNGRANLEEIEADGSRGHFEGLTLFLYNPQTGQWSQSFANSKEGTLIQPLIGEFKNGRGMLAAQEP